jgi:hypothetical protein
MTFAELRHVFTFADTPDTAFEPAALAEDVALTLPFARQIGSVTVLPPHEIEKWWRRYQSANGQR